MRGSLVFPLLAACTVHVDLLPRPDGPAMPAADPDPAVLTPSTATGPTDPTTGPAAPPVDLLVCGDGSGDYLEIQPAVDAAAPGDTIGLCPGTYAGFTMGWLQDVVVVGLEGAAATTIDGGAGPALAMDEGTLDLSGVTLTGTGIYDPWYPKGCVTDFEGTLTLTDSVVEGCTGPFTLLFDEDWLVVDGVTWRDNQTDWLWYLWQGEDDDVVPGTAILTNNVVDGGTFETVVETTKVFGVTLTNDVFANLTIDTAYTAFILNSFDGGTITVANDLFYEIDDLDPWGGRIFSGDPVLENDIVLGCDSNDLDPMTADWSIFADNGVDWAPLVTGTGDQYSDPLLADPAAGDYSLLPGSPAIDAGDPDPAWNDADGSRNDIGPSGG